MELTIESSIVDCGGTAASKMVSARSIAYLLPLTLKPGQDEPGRIWDKAEGLGKGYRWMLRSEITGGFVDEAIPFIKKAAEAKKPFYVNLWRPSSSDVPRTAMPSTMTAISPTSPCAPASGSSSASTTAATLSSTTWKPIAASRKMQRHLTQRLSRCSAVPSSHGTSRCRRTGGMTSDYVLHVADSPEKLRQSQLLNNSFSLAMA